ncbi:hypothetical protein WJX84_002904 [Apatococcus fuscideae]|uniref:Sfi1 spindle body domain-containing protein n=1 Tax=Apatococcus fuscideae TaxID=2026836 RepID=A0AAW1T5X4_9CHLO
MLKEHDRAVLANAVNQWRGAQHSAPVSPQVHGYSSAVPAHASGYRQWQEQPGVEQPSDDVRSESLDSLHIHAWRGAASESTNSIGTSAELSLADLPTPAGHQLPKQSIWSLIDLAEAKLEQELRLASPPRLQISPLFFQAWRHTASSKAGQRQARQRAEEQWQQRRPQRSQKALRQIFIRWAAAAACAAEALRRLRCMDRAATQRRCLVGWRGSARGASQQWHLANELARLRALRIIIKAWAELAACRRRRSHAVHSAWSRRKQARMQHAFASWQAYCAEAWQDWRLAESHVEARARAQRNKATIAACVARLRNQHIAGALATWRAWSAHQVSQKRLVQRAVHRLVHHHLHAAFSSWRTVSSQHSAERAVMARAILHMLNITKQRSLTGAFNVWHHRAQWKVASRSLVVKNHTVMRAWWAWQDFCTHQQQARERASHALALMLRQTQARAFHAWQEALETKQWRLDCYVWTLQLWQKNTISKAWTAWLEAHEEARSQNQMLQQCVLRWQAQALAQNFYAWQDAAQRQKYVREKLLTCVGHLQHGMLASAFCAWIDFAQQRQMKAAKLQAAVQRWSR